MEIITYEVSQNVKIAHDVSGYIYINLALNLTHQPKYKVALFCSTARQAHEAANNLMKLVETTCLIRNYFSGSPQYTFEFPNGSRILIRVPSDGVRGHRLHTMYIDSAIQDNLVRFCLFQYLTKYDPRFI